MTQRLLAFPIFALAGSPAPLHGKASLVGDAAESATNAPLSKAMILADDVAYLRAARVGGELAKAARAAYRQLNATNKLIGVVLDLRFADGDDYAVAAATADLFMAREHPLLDWGNGMVNSKAKTNAIPGPLAVLVNGETRGAAAKCIQFEVRYFRRHTAMNGLVRFDAPPVPNGAGTRIS